MDPHAQAIIAQASHPVEGEAPARSSGLADYLIAAGLAVITATLLLRLIRRRRLRQHDDDGVSARERMDRLETEARARRTLDTLMAEVQEHTRACAAQIEQRAIRVERLIAEADAKIAELRTLQGEHAANGIRTAHRAVAPIDEPHAQAEPEPEPAPVPVAPHHDPLARQIYELADEGRSSTEIARRLEESIGKVELILALRGIG